MPEHQFRFSIEFALSRVLFSLLGWTAIIGLPGLFVWMATLDKPGMELPVVCGIVGLVLLCCLLHSRRYWLRFFDRSPQLELYPGFLRAKQLGDTDIPWTRVRGLRGTEEVVGRDLSYIVLDTEDEGEVELDTAGLDAPMRRIFELAEALWRRRNSALQAEPTPPPDRDGM